MGIFQVWQRLTINFTTEEALIAQVEKQLTGSYHKVTPRLGEQLLQLSPIAAAKAVCQAGENLAPMFSYSLGAFVNKAGISECWINLLAQKGKEEDKLLVIEALGILRINQGSWPLIEILKGKNEALQMAAAKALSRLSTRKLIPALVQGLKEGEFWLPARVAPIILTEPDLAVSLLKELLEEQGLSEHVYLAALEILQEIRRPDIISFLEQIFPTASIQVQRKMLEIFREVGGANIKNMAVSLLKHPHWQVRLEAIKILEQLQVPSLPALLLPLAADKNEKVRQTAAWVLEEVKGL